MMKILQFSLILRAALPAVFFATGTLLLHAPAARSAEPIKLWQLAALADLSYVVDTEVKAIGVKNSGPDQKLPFAKFSFEGHEYLPLYRLNEGQTKVQALALHRDDGMLILSYAGTKDPFDALADLGIKDEDKHYRDQKAVYDAIEGGKKAGIYSEKEAKLLRQTQLKSSYRPAAGHGAPKGCPEGTFFDLRNGGECWSCPKGKHRTLFPVDGKKACIAPAGTKHSKAKKMKKPTGLLGIQCPKGEFLNPSNKTCYKCNKGYAYNPLKNDCFKIVGANFVRAKRENYFLCGPGRFLDIVLGTCWSCPKDYGRTLESVQSAHACLRQFRSGEEVYTRSWKSARLDDQMMVARRFAEKFIDKNGRVLPSILSELGVQKIDRVFVIGHSLGGYIAQVIAAERGTQAVTFNAPGAYSYDPKLKDKGKLVRNVARASDIVGQFGKHLGKKQDVPDLSVNTEGANFVGANHSITRLTQSLKAKGL